MPIQQNAGEILFGKYDEVNIHTIDHVSKMQNLKQNYPNAMFIFSSARSIEEAQPSCLGAS